MKTLGFRFSRERFEEVYNVNIVVINRDAIGMMRLID
jgi:hypothetical protein